MCKRTHFARLPPTCFAGHSIQDGDEPGGSGHLGPAEAPAPWLPAASCTTAGAWTQPKGLQTEGVECACHRMLLGPQEEGAPVVCDNGEEENAETNTARSHLHITLK